MGFTLGIACSERGFDRIVFQKKGRDIKRGFGELAGTLLDTMTSAITIFIASFILFDGQIITSPDLVDEILALLVLTL